MHTLRRVGEGTPVSCRSQVSNALSGARVNDGNIALVHLSQRRVRGKMCLFKCHAWPMPAQNFSPGTHAFTPYQTIYDRIYLRHATMAFSKARKAAIITMGHGHADYMMARALRHCAAACHFQHTKWINTFAHFDFSALSVSRPHSFSAMPITPFDIDILLYFYRLSSWALRNTADDGWGSFWQEKKHSAVIAGLATPLRPDASFA